MGFTDGCERARNVGPWLHNHGVGESNQLRFGLLDSAEVKVLSEKYDGDVYDMVLSDGLPRAFPIAETDGGLLMQSGFAMPGGKDYASGAHHHEPFSLSMWSAAPRRWSYSDGKPHADSLYAIWDGLTNGRPESSRVAGPTWCQSGACARHAQEAGGDTTLCIGTACRYGS